MRSRWFALALLAVAALWGARPADPDPAGAGRELDETLQRMRVFYEAVERIRTEYYDTVVLDPPDTLVRGAIEGMVRSLGDPYSHYFEPRPLETLQEETSGEFGGLGIMIGIERGRLTVIAPIEGTPADRAGLAPGDVIVKIGEEPTDEMPLQEAVSKLRGPVGTDVTITIERRGEVLAPITLTRGTIPIHSVKWRLLPDGIGVVRIGQFTSQTPEEIDMALAALRREGEVRALVLDLRRNPGGVLHAAVAVADRFLSSGVIVSTRGRHAEQNQEFRASAGQSVPDVPLVVLVDNGSASASEIVAGAIQDTRRGVLVGQRTFGKGSVQSVRELSDGSGLALTTALYYTPNGRKIHGEGLAPDVEVEGRPAPGGEELAAIQKDEFRNLLNDFVAGRDAYDEKDLSALHERMRGAGLPVSRDLLEVFVLGELTRRHDRGLYLEPRLDPPLKAAIDLLKASPILARGARAAGGG